MTQDPSLPESLVPFAQTIEQLRIPGIALRRSRHACGLQLGGAPLDPPGFLWPVVDGEDRPLCFLGQIDLAIVRQARQIEWLPEAGHLLFFYDMVTQPWGIHPEDSRFWRVLYIHASQALSPADIPVHPPHDFIATIWDGSSLRREQRREDVEVTFEQAQLTASPVDTWPHFEELACASDIDPSDETTDVKDAYDAFRTHHLPRPQHQISGMPFTLQAGRIDVEAQLLDQGISAETYHTLPPSQQQQAVQGFEDWELLLQLDSDESIGWMWGDCGLIYFLVRTRDAQRADFSRVRAIVHSF